MPSVQVVRDNLMSKTTDKPITSLAGLLVALVILHAMYFDAVQKMVLQWNSPEYGHGYFIPLITLYFIWKLRHEMLARPQRNSWAGVVVMLAGILIYYVGELGTLYVVTQYAWLLTLYGLLLTFLGWPRFRVIIMPLLFLAFMIPLPNFIYANLSSELQLISSKIGVAVIRLFGISVYLEGNVIDLGTYKLQVVEACSGLKYLFSLTTIGFICAWVFRGAMWKRIVIFLSTVPITIFMNSFRIGVTGILVEYGGTKHAEGFLHEFEGLVIFGAAMLILIAEMAILARIGRNKTTLVAALADIGSTDAGPSQGLTISRSFILGLLLIATAGLSFSYVGKRQEVVPQRKPLSSFPLEIDGWKGEAGRLEAIYLKALKLTDYLLARYHKGGRSLELYIAYYASQKKGASVHSPRSCLPGGGWRIQRHEIRGIDVNGKIVPVNRVLIRKGSYTTLVYYWFRQRGRDMSNEYLVKWRLFTDAISRNRTDGSLVRLTINIPEGLDVRHADAALTEFLRAIYPLLPAYIPD